MSDAVLIVDDEPNVLQSLRRLLRPDGYQIHLAQDGPAALEILARDEIAVILCDQRMPGMSGAAVLAEAYRLRPDAIRMTLTGYADLAAAQASINDGHVQQFLLKPWDDQHLRSVVRDGVKSYGLVRENRRLEALTRQQNEELEAWNHRLEEQVHQRTEELRRQNEDLRQTQRRLEQSVRDTVGVLAGTLEAHSPNLGIHAKRVAGLARQLAAQLGLDDDALRDVEFAAHLHDIGKLARDAGETPGDRRKPAAAKTPEHVPHYEVGFAILSRVAGFAEIARAVRHQRERFDGGGPPDGMKRDAIPLAARIIAVVNAYDKSVFSAAAPTRVAQTAGRHALVEGRGTRFDPQLVDRFLAYLDGLGAAADEDLEVELSPRRAEEGMVLSRPVHNLDGALLVASGTRLTPELLERLRGWGEVDPLLAGLFVRCQPEDAPAANVGPLGDLPHNVRDPGAMRRVLVVDDSALVCNALKRALHPAGIETVSTDSGWTALDLVAKNSFDAAVIDLLMPAMPGEELVDRLARRTPAIPCIILTANATRPRVLSLLGKPNVAGILLKPWDRERLIAAITAATTRA